MFKDKTFLYEVNPLTKLISLIFFFATVIFVQYGWYLLGLNIIFILLTDEYKYLNKTACISVIVGVIVLVYPQIMWINKFICLYIYVALLTKIVKMEQIKYLIEKCFYQLKIAKINNFFVKTAHFIRIWKKNYQNLLEIGNGYGINSTIQFKYFTVVESFKISKQDINDIMILYRMRFYNIYSRRTEVEAVKWEQWDTNYFMVHLLLFIITTVLGR